MVNSYLVSREPLLYAGDGSDVHEVRLRGDQVLVVDEGALCPVVRDLQAPCR